MSIPARKLCSALGLIGTVALASCTERPHLAVDHQLQLTEISRYELPHTLRFSDAAIADDGAVLVWMQGAGEAVLIDPSGQRIQIQSPKVRSIVGASFIADDTIAVLDGSERVEIRLSRDGRELSSNDLPVANVPQSAVRIRGGWLIGAVTDESTYVMVDISDDALVRAHRSIEIPVEYRQGRPPVHLASIWGEASYTWREAPFHTQLVATGRQSRLALPPDLVTVLTLDSAWVAMAPVSFDGGAIQTISHLRSDARTMLLFAEDGSFVRSTRIETPLGIVSVAAQRPLLLAARNVGAVELVVYEWTWVQEM